MPPPNFTPGQTVRLRVDASRAGAVLSLREGLDGIWRYLVFHGVGDQREYDESQLVLDSQSMAPDDLLDAFSDGVFVDPDEFRARITAARLSHPVVDNLYAMRAARILHVPFQYKPLLRLLRADRPRLLIADDVGVGKTIEAGLILKELQARHDVGNVAVVCPKALAYKWHEEMRRFDEQFRVMTGSDLREAIRQTHSEGVWPREFDRVVMPLELIQREEYRIGDPEDGQFGLATLDEPPQFGLLIVDEAHHLRNPGTGRHQAIEFLAGVSEAAVFLSATPVHVGSENLFTLLALLRPELFPDLRTFRRMVEPNRFITQAMRLVRAGLQGGDSWQQDAYRELELASRTDWGQTALRLNPHFTAWHERLSTGAPIGDEDRIRCLRDLEEAHTLSLVMNRTRRRDVGRFTQREPKTVQVPFTPPQEAFYSALIDWRMRLLQSVYNPLVAHLIMTTIERQATSCLARVAGTLEAMIASGCLIRRVVTDVEDDDGETETEVVEIPPELLEEAEGLLYMARQLPDTDPKRDELLKIVSETMADAYCPGKVLVFSFFLTTLRYLLESFGEAGVRVALISGQVPEEERQHLRNRFRLDRSDRNAIDVLLSSEVGCEGLDYEFCDRMVNYDIPWNPMRVEQRIGRIDRFGQKAPKVLIYNFVTPGTIEDRVFFRNFERLGIFRDTVGDLEEVLGETVTSFGRLATDPSLSPKQVEERARQESDNVVRRIDEQRRLEEQSAGLLGLDFELQQEAEAITAAQKFVTGDDLRAMIAGFFDREFGAGRLTSDSGEERLQRIRLTRDQRHELRDRVRRLGRRDRATTELVNAIAQHDQIPVTFDAELAIERRDIPFVTPTHPLARIAMEFWLNSSGPLVAQLAVHEPSERPGQYLFAFERWEVIAARPEVRLVGFAIGLSDDRPASTVAARLIDFVREATRVPDTAPVAVSDATRAALDQVAQQARRDEVARLRASNAALINQRVAALESYFTARLVRIDTELGDQAESRIVRMKRAERSRIEQEFSVRLAAVERRRDADIVPDRLAVGVIEVLP
jgi:ATP-dependent helicase HepA